MFWESLQLTLPVTDPVMKFLIILLIILVIPILSDKIKIPHLLGMIIAGVMIGPHGFNFLPRDSGIILSGTTGLLYIMFLAGLEIDMIDFRKNAGRSTMLGIYGFLIPMILGTLTGLYVFMLSPMSSVLLASMFASHTLITYPIVSKLGITKNRAVNISVGSTLITNTLALLVLAIIVGMATGNMGNVFWIRLTLSFILFLVIITTLFPIIARWFFKRFSDNVTQYIFVLFMVFLGAVLSQAAGIEAIIGAFLAGLSLNRLIPRTSPLMNRIDFVGNAIFIPFFLIGVGMLIDYRAFGNAETLLIAVVMSVIATAGKFVAAWATQKQFSFSRNERQVIFGLTNAQAAATLAAVMVGYNIILDTDESGNPIRLLNDAVLNGTIIMILVTCTIASLVTQKGATRLALAETAGEESDMTSNERILIPVSNPETLDELVKLGMLIKSKNNTSGFYALSVITRDAHESEAPNARKILEKALVTASAADIRMNEILRFDVNIFNGIAGVIREQNITDLVLGLHIKKRITESFLGEVTEGLLAHCNVTTFIVRPAQPFSTIRRHLVLVPKHAERVLGFPFWISKVWNLASNTGARVNFICSPETEEIIRGIHDRHPIAVEFTTFSDWDNLNDITPKVKPDDNFILVMSRENKPSYHRSMRKIPDFLSHHFAANSLILIYPMQIGISDDGTSDLSNPSLLEPIARLDEMVQMISRLIKRR